MTKSPHSAAAHVSRRTPAIDTPATDTPATASHPCFLFFKQQRVFPSSQTAVNDNVNADSVVVVAVVASGMLVAMLVLVSRFPCLPCRRVFLHDNAGITCMAHVG